MCCKNCGGNMCGDGITTVRHCENTERDVHTVEPDAAPILCCGPEFKSFSKIARLNRVIIITEKIDGTNAQIHITDDGQIYAGSRNRWLNIHNDNFGFADWTYGHREELLKLGPGTHYGEWWGNGIQRGYGLKERRFSLFNVHRWLDPHEDTVLAKLATMEVAPACCYVVPIIYQGPFSEGSIIFSLEDLKAKGSTAAPGFMNPEGIVIYHTAAKTLFKVTIKDDAKPKGASHE